MDGMIVFYKLRGEFCKYKQYVYRIPLLSPVIAQKTKDELSIRDQYINALAGVDINRVYPPSLKFQEVADCRFVIDTEMYMKKVELFMCSNKHTLAKRDAKIGEWRFVGPDYDNIGFDELKLKMMVQEAACNDW